MRTLFANRIMKQNDMVLLSCQDTEIYQMNRKANIKRAFEKQETMM